MSISVLFFIRENSFIYYHYMSLPTVVRLEKCCVVENILDTSL